MPNFEYRVTDPSGQEYAGILEAASQQELERNLRDQGYTVVSVAPEAGTVTGPKTKGGTRRGATKKAGGKGGKAAAKNSGKVKSKVLMLFTRQLATLIGSGLPLLRGLTVLGKQEPVPAMRAAIQDIGNNVQSGSTFSESLAGHPKLFNKLYVNMVKAGELGGVLEVVLERLAEYQEKAQKLKNKIVSAMAYPVIVLTIAVLIVVFLMVFIVPRFEKMFTDMLGEGAKLPALTRAVTGVSRFFVESAVGPVPNVVLIVVVLFLLAIGFKAYSSTAAGRLNIDRLKLNIPIFGGIQRKSAIARFSRTLGTLVSSGVPILQALNITRDTAGNEVIAAGINKIHDAVKEGESIVTPMEGTKVFPPMVISMVDVGEETGQLPDMLLKVADLYDDEVDNAVAGATAMMEPLMIVFLALVVGTIVIALFLPLTAIIQGMQS